MKGIVLKKIFYTLLAVCLVVSTTAEAQNSNAAIASKIVSEQNGNVIYRTQTEAYAVCENGNLKVDTYVSLLKGLTDRVVMGGMVDKMLAVYDQQNAKSQGQMAKITQQLRNNMTQEEVNQIYGPHKDKISADAFMKVHTLNAAGVSQAMLQSLGNERMQQLCKTQTASAQ